MAKTKKKPKTTENNTDLLAKRLSDEYQRNFNSMAQIRSEFDYKEKILMALPDDSFSKSQSGSGVIDPTLLSAILKQNNELVGKEPTGVVKATSLRQDKGKSLLIDLILRNHIVPNANTQNTHFIKLWMLALLRDVYGSSFTLTDYVDRNGYRGADFTLIHPRNVVPQQGRYTVQDCEYVDVRSVVSKKWLSDRNPEYWKNIQKVIEKGGGVSQEYDYQSSNQGKYDDISVNSDDYELITRYYPDRWVTFNKKSQLVVRDIKNPQKNSEIPLVKCDAYPLLDRFIALGEFERGRTLHNAGGSLINMYLRSVKMSIQPPMKVDLKGVVARTLKIQPGAMIAVKNGNMNALEQLQISPQGLNTFQSTYGFLKGAILSLTNSSDTSVSESVDVGMGKTPQALRMQQFDKDMKVNFKRKMLDEAIEQIYNKLIDVFVNRQEEPVELEIFGKDLESISQTYPDVLEMFESDGGSLMVKPEMVKGLTYRFTIDAGSTTKKDQAIENQTLTSMIELLFKIPGAMEQAISTGFIQMGTKTINVAEIFAQWFATSGFEGAEKIVQDTKNQDGNFEDPNLAGQFGGLTENDLVMMAQGLNPEQQQILMDAHGNSNTQY